MKRTKSVTVEIEPEILKAIKTLAAANERSVSYYARVAMRELISRSALQVQAEKQGSRGATPSRRTRKPEGGLN